MSFATSTTSDVRGEASLYQRPLKSQLRGDDWTGPPFHAIYVGVAVHFHFLGGATIACAVRDSVYPLDYAQYELACGSRRDGWIGLTESILGKN
ncbi:trehalose synthase [Penicillium canescens]|nr:trehalose synthase [Penicillium canescens]